jgi:hypothetical protein
VNELPKYFTIDNITRKQLRPREPNDFKPDRFGGRIGVDRRVYSKKRKKWMSPKSFQGRFK